MATDLVLAGKSTWRTMPTSGCRNVLLLLDSPAVRCRTCSPGQATRGAVRIRSPAMPRSVLGDESLWAAGPGAVRRVGWRCRVGHPGICASYLGVAIQNKVLCGVPEVLIAVSGWRALGGHGRPALPGGELQQSLVTVVASRDGTTAGRHRRSAGQQRSRSTVAASQDATTATRLCCSSPPAPRSLPARPRPLIVPIVTPGSSGQRVTSVRRRRPIPESTDRTCRERRAGYNGVRMRATAL
jgi:hypothetical protein